MLTHYLIQGSPEWTAYREQHFNSSDCPAMLGISPHKSRTQLLNEMSTGITPEIDAATQSRFDAGHRFETLARPLAEEIIGQMLYPVTGSVGRLSASFDGLTAAEDVCWEHKTLNDSIRSSSEDEDDGDASELAEHYRAQMEQQMMVSGAERCLFMASKWDESDTLVEEMHIWYESDADLRQRIIQGWEQFAIDLEKYVPVQAEIKPIGAAIMDLPSLTIQATGMVTYSNLQNFTAVAEQYIASINTELVTDQNFADAETTIKYCKTTEDNLDVTKSAVRAQISDIDEVIRTLTHIQAQLRDKRLMLDKLVKSEKEARKKAMVMQANAAYAEHVAVLQDGISSVRLHLLLTATQFGAAIKGLKSLASMQDALDTALANCKSAANSIAIDVRAKLAWAKERAAGHIALFPDLQNLIGYDMDAFTALITGRIEKAKADEAARLEAERIRMEAVEVAKEHEAQPELISNVVPLRTEDVLDKQDVVGAFLKSRNFADESRIRAILIEFIKFDGGYKNKGAA